MTIPSAIAGASRVAALAVLLLSQACLYDYTAPPGVDLKTPEPASLSWDNLHEHPLLLDIARQTPGFGGLYYEPGDDPLGVDPLVVSMTPGHAGGFPAAQRAVLSALAENSSSPTALANVAPYGFVERVVQYPFIDLARHRARLLPRLFRIPGVEALDVDEGINRIAIGLSDESAKGEVYELAIEMGIPLEMLSFWETRRPHYERRLTRQHSTGHARSRWTVRDRVPDDMLVGGYQVEAKEWDSSSEICTLGFTALRIPEGDSVFVSAGHCSWRRYEVDHGRWYQPTELAEPEPVGREIAEAQKQPCTRHTSGECVLADVSLMRAEADIALGKIARLTGMADCRVPNDPNDKDCLDWVGDTLLFVNRSRPTLTVTSFGRNNFQNERLHKVGRTTGWTIGPVKRTCVDYKYQPVICSDLVDYLSGGGDSGSPVFKMTSVPESTVELRGIHWGKDERPGWADEDDEDDATGYALISPMRHIFESVGPLWVQAGALPEPLAVRIVGPHNVPPNTECRWEAEVSGGIGPYRYGWEGPVRGNPPWYNKVFIAVIKRSGPLTVTVVDRVGIRAGDSIYVNVRDGLDDWECPV